MIEKLFIGNTTNLSKKVYFWTVLSGTFYSASTYILFLICSWFLGGYWAGVFSIVMSIGQQLVTIGYFNTRTFQVSDVKGQFEFSDYFVSKLITSAIMLAACFIWCFAGGFTKEKTIAVFFMTIFKIGEAIADVCQGLYQQKGRYDISGRCVFWETLGCVLCFALTIIVSRNLILGLFVLAFSYILLVFVFEKKLVDYFADLKIKFVFAKQKSLFIECLPLFVNSFLLVYINNSSKYALDRYESPEKLANFNAIFMVAFVVNLLAGFILKPIISVIANHYANNEWGKIKKIIIRQISFIIVITLICIMGAYLLGIPVLSMVSGLDLSSYRMILCIVIFGGAFNAIYQLFSYVIIIFRKQYACFWGSVIAAVIVTVAVFGLVSQFGVWGATIGYVFSMMLLAGIYFIMTLYFMKKIRGGEHAL